MKPVVALLVCLPVVLGAQSSASNGTPADTLSLNPARVVTLDEAVRLAQRNATATVQVQGDVATSEEALRAVHAAFIPSLGLSASRTYQGGDVLGPTGTILTYNGRSWRSGDGLDANVTLFAGGQRLYAVRPVSIRSLRSGTSNG